MNWDFENELEVVATLSEEARKASIEMTETYERLTAEVGKLAAQGVSIDALSAATGLSPEAIKLLQK